MTSADFKLLGRIFDAESRDLLPAQIRSKRLTELAREGLVARMRKEIPGRFPVIVEGWSLTMKGHIFYCEECLKR